MARTKISPKQISGGRPGQVLTSSHIGTPLWDYLPQSKEIQLTNLLTNSGQFLSSSEPFGYYWGEGLTWAPGSGTTNNYIDRNRSITILRLKDTTVFGYGDLCLSFGVGDSVDNYLNDNKYVVTEYVNDVPNILSLRKVYGDKNRGRVMTTVNRKATKIVISLNPNYQPGNSWASGYISYICLRLVQSVFDGEAGIYTPGIMEYITPSDIKKSIGIDDGGYVLSKITTIHSATETRASDITGNDQTPGVFISGWEESPDDTDVIHYTGVKGYMNPEAINRSLYENKELLSHGKVTFKKEFDYVDVTLYVSPDVMSDIYIIADGFINPFDRAFRTSYRKDRNDIRTTDSITFSMSQLAIGDGFSIYHKRVDGDRDASLERYCQAEIKFYKKIK